MLQALPPTKKKKKKKSEKVTSAIDIFQLSVFSDGIKVVYKFWSPHIKINHSPCCKGNFAFSKLVYREFSSDTFYTSSICRATDHSYPIWHLLVQSQRWKTIGANFREISDVLLYHCWIWTNKFQLVSCLIKYQCDQITWSQLFHILL